MANAYDQPDVSAANAYPPIPSEPLPLDELAAPYTTTASSSSYPTYYSLPPADAYNASTVYDLSPSQQQHSGQQPLFPQHYQLPPASTAPPSSSAPPSSAAMLMQQHQANQQAFRSSQASTAFQQNHLAANQGDSTASGSSASAEQSREGSTGSNRSLEQRQDEGVGSNGDADFTQTFYDPFKIKHRRRTSPPQLKVLEYHFEINSKPDVTLRKALSEQLDMTPREVQVWFQNRRAKVKKLREKAEREAAQAADEAARNGEVYDANQKAPHTALNAPASELPVPPPAFAQPFPPAGRTIYGQQQQQDLLSLRRGSSPAVFGSSSSSALPTPPLAFEASFQPAPTAAPFQHLPPNQPFPQAAYPSPVSLTTPSPNDFLAAAPHPVGQDVAQPPPTAVPAYFAGESAAGPGSGISRRFSLPAYNSGYLPTPNELPTQPYQTPQQHLHPHQQLGVPHSLAPQQQPVQAAYAVSAPTESAYLDQLGPPLPLPAQIDALSLGSGGVDGHGVPLESHSPSSSLGESALSWDGPAQPFALDGVPDHRHQQQHFRATYAPSVPSQLGSRRASCPEGPGSCQVQHQTPFNHLTVPAQPSWTDPQSLQQDFGESGISASSPFYGYSMAASSASASASNHSLPSPHVSPHPGYAQPPHSLSRRGSIAAPPVGLVTIAEQPPVPSFDPSALSGALAPHQQQTPSPTEGPPPIVLGERRGSVIRKSRSTRDNLHSPYAAAVHEQRGVVGGGMDAGLGLL
ncbi:hypothetical protein JCM11251_002703 [Rhodosporidiobolus azoricus]